MGSLVKRRWCSSAGRDPALTYHCAVMPCYDKKLEAAREDFLLPGGWQWGGGARARVVARELLCLCGQGRAGGAVRFSMGGSVVVHWR
jgi:hypothetical protein